MKTPYILSIVALIGTFYNVPLRATTVTSNAVVINLVNVPGVTDQYCAPNGHRTPIHVGTVKALNNNPTIYENFNYWKGIGWGNLKAIEGGCYVEILSGAAAGYKFDVDFNNGTGVKLKDNIRSGSPLGIAVGDRFQIVPKWTQKTLLQDLPQGSELLSLSTTPSGINNGAISSAQFYTGFGWYTGVTSTDDSPIEIDEVFVLRNNSSSTQVFWSWGHVSQTPQYRENVSTLAGLQNDHYITFTGAMPVTLANLPNLPEDGDEIFFFDFDLVTQNKGAARQAIYYAGFGWYSGVTNVDTTEIIEPGCGYLIRKASKPTANAVHTWSDLNTY